MGQSRCVRRTTNTAYYKIYIGNKHTLQRCTMRTTINGGGGGYCHITLSQYFSPNRTHFKGFGLSTVVQSIIIV